MSRENSVVTTGGTVTKKEEAAIMEEQAQVKLTAEDRCDSCGAQAYVRVVLQGGELDFCGHHANKYEATLVGVAIFVTDQRSKINEKRDVPVDV